MRSGAPFASVLASYLPHYSEAQALTVWAEQPPPDMESLWDEYDALVSAAGTASFNSTETSSRDRESGWWARLIAAASDSIRLTPLDQATRLDALTEAGEARDLIAAIGAAAEINTSGFAEWRAKADQRAQLDRVLAELSEDS